MIKEDLAHIVGDVLELPSRNRGELPHRIVSAVIEALTKTLISKGRVEIGGLGVFTIRVRPATRRGCVYHYHMNRKGNVIVQDIPARKYVHFKPSKLVVKELNESSE